jgi:hypothetical protein
VPALRLFFLIATREFKNPVLAHQTHQLKLELPAVGCTVFRSNDVLECDIALEVLRRFRVVVGFEMLNALFKRIDCEGDVEDQGGVFFGEFHMLSMSDNMQCTN